MTSINAIGAQNPNAVATGGTGNVTLTTPYGTLCSGTTTTNPIQTVSTGAAGSLLTSGGAGALPSYLGPFNGFTWIASATASNSATIAFANNLTATYDNYIITLENVTNVTNAQSLMIVLGFGSTPTYITSQYSGVYLYPSQASTVLSASVGTASWTLLLNQTNTGPAAGNLFISNANAEQSSNKSYIFSQIAYFSPTPTWVPFITGGSVTISAPTTSIKFSYSSGNISTGIFKLYGQRN